MSATANAYTLGMKAQLDALNVKVMPSGHATDAVGPQCAQWDQSERRNPRLQTAHALTQAQGLRYAGENLRRKVTAEVEKLRDSFVNSFLQFKSQR